MKKGGGGLRAPAAVQYAWLQQQQGEFRGRRLGRRLEVSRSGYYEWLGRPPRAHSEADQPGQAQVQRLFAPGRGPYGTRRRKPLWAPEGLPVRRRRIGRVLAQAGRRGKTRRRVKASTAAGPAQTVAPHQRTRAFTVPAPDTVYVGDIPYLPPGEGWRSLAIVREVCSRAVVGWALAPPMRAALGTQAWSMALCQRQPAASLIMHTDRGRQ
jgi:putative transposase